MLNKVVEIQSHETLDGFSFTELLEQPFTLVENYNEFRGLSGYPSRVIYKVDEKNPNVPEKLHGYWISNEIYMDDFFETVEDLLDSDEYKNDPEMVEVLSKIHLMEEMVPKYSYVELKDL
jgi:hypothetical protein